MKATELMPLNTNFPYDKGGNTLDEFIDGIFDNLKYKKRDIEVVSFTRIGFKEICEHIAEWQKQKTTAIIEK